MLMTHVGADVADAAAFAGLHHQPWRTEEAFNRIRHRMHPESVSGLSQHTLLGVISLADPDLAPLTISSLIPVCATRELTYLRRIGS